MDTATEPVIDRYRAYRRRLAAKGNHQVVLALPHDIVAELDELKERHGLPSRSQALLQLIEKGRAAAQ